MSRNYFYLCFTDEGTGLREIRNPPKPRPVPLATSISKSPSVMWNDFPQVTLKIKSYGGCGNTFWKLNMHGINKRKNKNSHIFTDTK